MSLSSLSKDTDRSTHKLDYSGSKHSSVAKKKKTGYLGSLVNNDEDLGGGSLFGAAGGFMLNKSAYQKRTQRSNPFKNSAARQMSNMNSTNSTTSITGRSNKPDVGVYGRHNF